MTSDSRLALHSCFREEVATVSVAGELDAQRSLRVRGELLAAADDPRAKLLIVDLTELEFIDCATAAALAETSGVRRESLRSKPVVTSSSIQVERVLSLTGVASCLHMVSDLDEARSLSHPPTRPPSHIAAGVPSV